MYICVYVYMYNVYICMYNIVTIYVEEIFIIQYILTSRRGLSHVCVLRLLLLFHHAH